MNKLIKISKTTDELELKYSFPRIGGLKFKIIPKDYSHNLEFLLPYINYFISHSQDDMDTFFINVPYQAIEESYSITVKFSDSIDSWFVAEVNKISDNYLALSLFRIYNEGMSIMFQLMMLKLIRPKY